MIGAERLMIERRKKNHLRKLLRVHSDHLVGSKRNKKRMISKRTSHKTRKIYNSKLKLTLPC